MLMSVTLLRIGARHYSDSCFVFLLSCSVTVKTLREWTHRWMLVLDNWKWKQAWGERGGWLTWNMTLYCSSGFWTTHMLHPIMTFNTSPRRPPLSPQISWSGGLFVCGSGRAPPSLAELWCIWLLRRRVTHNTPWPGTDGWLYVDVSLFSPAWSHFKCCVPS